MKKQRKRLTRFFAALLTCVLLGAASWSAGAAEEKSRVYAAFGDSIAYGYGLYAPASDGFCALTAKEIDARLCNYAVNGMTSGGLLELLQTMQPGDDAYKSTQNAALITVTIGSNDLLSVFSDLLRPLEGMQESAQTGGALSDADAALLEAMLTSDSAKERFTAGIESYRSNLPAIYARLREINPDAPVIMTGFYNPYYGFRFGAYDFSADCAGYIARLNAILEEGAAEMDYSIASIAADFEAEGLTCATLSPLNLDPHPNVVGHSVIAGRVIEALPASLKSTPSSVQTDAPAESQVSPDGEKKVSDTRAFVYGTCLAVAVLSFGITAAVSIYKNKQNPKKHYRRF